jgi:hypothetical protein
MPRVRHAPQPQLGGQAQTSQPHALPQQQRAASARRAVAPWERQDVQAQALAVQGEQEQEVVVELDMAHLAEFVVGHRTPPARPGFPVRRALARPPSSLAVRYSGGSARD